MEKSSHWWDRIVCEFSPAQWVTNFRVSPSITCVTVYVPTLAAWTPMWGWWAMVDLHSRLTIWHDKNLLGVWLVGVAYSNRHAYTCIRHARGKYFVIDHGVLTQKMKEAINILLDLAAALDLVWILIGEVELGHQERKVIGLWGVESGHLEREKADLGWREVDLQVGG